MTKTPICGNKRCRNDGSKAGLYLTIDANWRADVGAWKLEERNDTGGMELDCLACDVRTPVEGGESGFPYDALIKPDGSIAGAAPVLSDAERVALIMGLDALADMFASEDDRTDVYTDEDRAAHNARLDAGRAAIARLGGAK